MICDYEALKALIEELTPQESCWKPELLGVLLGSTIGFLFTILINYFQNKREDKIHLREKREDTYLRMLNILYLLRNETLVPNNKSISEKRRQEIDECFAPINVYAPKPIKNMYIKAAKQIDLFFMNNHQDTKSLENALDLIDEFIKLIRKELGIKN